MFSPSLLPVYITSIEVIEKENLVFNFSVEDDESYVLNGIISHNCRCRLEPAMDNIPERPTTDAKDFMEWLDT